MRAMQIPGNGKRLRTTLRGAALLLLSLGSIPLLCDSMHAQAPSRDGLRPIAGIDARQTAALQHIDAFRDANLPDSAWVMLEKLIPAARAAGDSVFLLQLTARHGALLCGLGRTQRSIPILHEALELCEALADTMLMCPTLRWLSLATSTTGDHAGAAGLCRRLLPLARAVGDPAYEGWAQVGLAWHEQVAGNPEQALTLWQAAAIAFERGREMGGLAWARNGTAALHSNRGAYDEALRYRLLAALAADQIPNETERLFTLSSILNTLAVLEFELGDPGAAEEHFQQARDLQREIGHQSAQITPALNVAICRVEQGRFTEACADLQRLAVICEEDDLRPMLGKVLVQLAETRQRMGRHHEAVDILRRAISSERDFEMHTRVMMRVNLARALAALDSLPTALAILEEGANLLTEAVAIPYALELQTTEGELLLQDGRDREALERFRVVDHASRDLGPSDERITALTLAGRACRKLGWVDSAAVYLNRASEVWEADRQVPLDPEWREQRGARGRGLCTEIIALELEETTDAHIRAAYEQAQRFKTRTLIERMLGPGHKAHARAESHLPAHPTLPFVQGEILRPREIFLDVFLGETGGFLFAITRDTCAVIALAPEAVLDQKLRLLLRAAATLDETAISSTMLSQVCLRFGRLILGDLVPLIEASERILFSPDGVLNLLPLGLLPHTGTALPLSATHQIVRVPSAAILARRRTQLPVRPTTDGILAVASVKGPEGRRLAGTRAEVRYLEHTFRAVDMHIIGEGRDSFAVEGLLPRYQVLHFASHAQVNDQNPWRSTIQLDPGNEALNPRADRISELSLPARLVVLASCRTAHGKIRTGEGVQGLTSAFLSAGVPAVVASLWPVDDRATATLMRSFYDELAAGRSAASALMAARETLRRDAATRRPFYWAGFVLVGDGSIRLQLERRSVFPRRLLAGLIAAGILGGLAAGGYALRRRSGDTTGP